MAESILDKTEKRMNSLLSSRSGEIQQIKNDIAACFSAIADNEKSMDAAVRAGNTEDYISAKNKIEFLTSKKEMLNKRLEQIKAVEMVSPEDTRETIGAIHKYAYDREMELTEEVIVSLEQLRALRDQTSAVIDRADELCYNWDSKVSKYTNPKMPKVKPSPLYEYHNVYAFLNSVLDHPGLEQIKEELEAYQKGVAANE